MRHDLARLSSCSEKEIAALSPLPQDYSDIYICVAWPYWFGLHAEKPLKIQLQRLQYRYPRLKLGRNICATIHAAPPLPAEMWQRIHAFAGDDVLRTVRLAISIARHRHAD